MHGPFLVTSTHNVDEAQHNWMTGGGGFTKTYERLVYEYFSIVVFPCERVRTHHRPVNIFNDVGKEGRVVAGSKVPENLADLSLTWVGGIRSANRC